LAKNENSALPLSTQKPLKILVTGPTSHSLSFQSGGWTGQWQGVNSNFENEWFTYGSTVFGAMKTEASLNSAWQVSYQCGVDILGNDCEAQSEEGWPKDNDGFVDTVKGWVGWKEEDYVGIASAMKQASVADVIIVSLGEENYTEKPGDIRTLNLPTGQYELVAALREAAPQSKIILVYFGGRPRLLADVVPQVDAVLLAFLPGPFAGDALVDILTGRVNPSARLPITYPKFEDLGGVPYLHSVSDMCTKDTGVLPHWENIPCEVQWPFGHGLSYTQFNYSDIQLNTQTLHQYWDVHRQTKLVVSVNVTNTGKTAGSDTILFFTFDEFRSTTPEYKRLRGYRKIWLEPGLTTEVTISISLDDLRFVGPHDDTHYILEDGVFRVGLGPNVDCRIDPGNDLCSDPVSVRTESNYVGACEAACELWDRSGCTTFSPTSCREACSSIHTNDHSENGMQLNNDGWGWPYVNCLESLIWHDAFNSDKDCWKLTSFCRDVIKTPGMDEFGSGKAPRAFARLGIPPAAIALSLFAGVLASVMILLTMKGRFMTKEERNRDDIRFDAVSTVEFT